MDNRDMMNRAAPGSGEFVPYRCGPLRGICVAGYETFDLSAIPWDKATLRASPDYHLAKSSRTRRVVRLAFCPPGETPRIVYAKRTLVTGLRKRLGHVFVRSKARREWQAGYTMLAMGLAAARPVVCAEWREGPWLRANYLVTEEVVGASPLLSALAHVSTAEERRDLLDRLSRWLYQAHRRGFYHDDCSAQHVFVRVGRAGSCDVAHEFCFIDLDNCRFHRSMVPWGRRVKNLFQILRSIPLRCASQSDRLRFVESYLEASGEQSQSDRALATIRRLARSKKASIHF